MKLCDDRKINKREFNVGYLVLFFKSKIKLYSEKLNSKWRGPHRVTRVFPYGALELENKKGLNFKVNGQRVKHYLGSIDEVKIVCDVDLGSSFDVNHS